MRSLIPPLAWLQLTREKTRLLVALAGIAFAVILMLMQLGFRDALFDSAVRIHHQLKSDIFILNSESLSLIELKEFSQRRLYQTLGIPGVESVSPIYIGYGSWKNPQTGGKRSLMTIGIDLEHNVLDLPAVKRNLPALREDDSVLFDSESRPEFGDIAKLLKQKSRVTVELEDRRVTVKGLFNLGASFGSDGTAITSDLNFIRIFNQQRSKGLIDIGAISLKKGASTAQTIQEIQKSLPQDIQVLSKAQFIELEKSYWRGSTAIGFIFTIGAILGFVVGTVIVYQILYADVTDQLVEYATLKAIGYSNFYLSKLVFQEAVLLSILGFIPGFAICLQLYQGAREGSGLPLEMTLKRSLTVFFLTILMCAISGLIAMRKTRSADPADIF
ncbi:ABC transporter permease DevC [Pleurocapsa sp. FMAR1]|uniref:ABC transporter permease DevC n=1 Tax=Pleurocapsa sp. FMAR1 TaxID=3040204 RepID=UPI0029C72A02|nr:ABC transporter permease DevC [Pleurocapsa sp. FMAR1]